MSSSALISRFLVGALFAFSFPANTPWDKPADQWTAADANKILEDSPWAPSKVTIEAKFTQKHTEPLTGLISDSDVNLNNSNNIRGVQISKGGTPSYYVKWMSAKTMRLALEKMHRMRTNMVGTRISGLCGCDRRRRTDANHTQRERRFARHGISRTR